MDEFASHEGPHGGAGKWNWGYVSDYLAFSLLNRAVGNLNQHFLVGLDGVGGGGWERGV